MGKGLKTAVGILALLGIAALVMVGLFKVGSYIMGAS